MTSLARAGPVASIPALVVVGTGGTGICRAAAGRLG